MRLALREAEAAAAAGEVPVGAVLVDPAKGAVIAQGQNRTLRDTDPTAHAEIVALRGAAGKLGNHRLNGLELYVTLEPCAMCAGAIAEARLARLVYAAADPKSGGVAHGACVFSHPQCHHKLEVRSGVMAGEAAQLLRTFFAARRR